MWYNKGQNHCIHSTHTTVYIFNRRNAQLLVIALISQNPHSQFPALHSNPAHACGLAYSCTMQPWHRSLFANTPSVQCEEAHPKLLPQTPEARSELAGPGHTCPGRLCFIRSTLHSCLQRGRSYFAFGKEQESREE